MDLKSLFDWRGHKTDDPAAPTLLHALRGGGKGFLLSLAILGVLKRSKFSREELKLSGVAATFVGSYRLFFSLFGSEGSRKKIVQQIANILPITEEKVETFIKDFTPGLAGWLATFLGLFVDGFTLTENSVFVTYCVTRALWFCTSSNPLQLPSQLEHLYPFGWMTFSATIILALWFLHPKMLDPKYVSFLNRQGGHDISKFVFRDPSLGVQGIQMCGLVHPGLGCWEHKLRFFLTNVQLASKLYLPIHLFILAISRSRSLFKFLFGLTRSSVFLALYCTFAWANLCVASTVAPYHKVGMGMLMYVGSAAGFSVLVEDPRRQALLAAYCMTYAIDGLYKMLLHRFKLRHTKRLGTILIVSSAAFLFQKYDRWVPHALQTWLLHCPVKDEPTYSDKPVEKEEGEMGDVDSLKNQPAKIR